MFKIEGDYRFINVTSIHDSSTYINGNNVPTVKYNINASYELTDVVNRFKAMELEWQTFKINQEIEKNLIANNPAVREAYKNYLTMAALAKEHNNVT